MLSGGDGLVDGFVAAGWTAERLVVMALRRRRRARRHAQAEVREVGFEPVRALMEAWYGESMTAAEARDLADSDADTAARVGRALLPRRARRRAGRVLRAARLRRDRPGRVRLHAPAAHRGHGLASVVVRAAIAASRERGDDLLIIMADADDWPQRLYERLGFETVDAYRASRASRRLTSPKAQFDEVKPAWQAKPLSDVRRPPAKSVASRR